MTVEHEAPTQHGERGTSEHHAPSVAATLLRPKRPAPESFAAGTVRGFFTQLKNKLNEYGITLIGMPTASSPENPPACFALDDTPYRDWLKAASEYPPPVRLDMPAEPNYCYDCTPEFKARAIKAGACRFPNTRFEFANHLGEREVVGVSRPADVIADADVLLGEMTVPLASLHGALRAYVDRAGIREISEAEWQRIPDYVKSACRFRGRS